MWKSPFKSLPIDAEVVWIRVISIYGPPALAAFDLASNTFVTSTTGITVPAYMIGRWKSQ